jgi:hypothetical protein
MKIEIVELSENDDFPVVQSRIGVDSGLLRWCECMGGWDGFGKSNCFDAWELCERDLVAGIDSVRFRLGFLKIDTLFS